MSLRKSPVLTETMIAANRANASRSTGPRSPEGKSRVKFNVLRHGRRAHSFREAIVALGGDPAYYDQRLKYRLHFYAPQTLRDLHLIELLAQDEWLIHQNRH